MELPKTPLPPSRTTPKFLYLYGQPKVGKTTILSKLSNCLIISTDPGGADYVSALKVQVNNYKEFMDVCKEIKKQSKPYKYVALDTTTTLEEWCEPEATDQYKKTNQGKNFDGKSVLDLVGPDFNPGYRFIRETFREAMKEFYTCADHVIAVGHIRDKYLKAGDATERGKSDANVSATEIDHSGKIRAMICVGADAIGYLYRTSNQDGSKQTMKISFQTKEHINCGSRAEHLAGKIMDMDWKTIYDPENKGLL